MGRLSRVRRGHRLPENAAIDNALPEKGAVRLLVSVPGDAEVDLAGVEVTIGRRGRQTPRPWPPPQSGALKRTSILAIDTSASMRGTRIAEAKKAALAYLATVPANVEVGVLTFDSKVSVKVPPTLDRDAARAAVAGLQLTLKTALYDGVLGALEAAGPDGPEAGQRKILVLSDGKDTTTTPLDDRAWSEIKASDAQVNVVSLQRGDEANAPLNAIAKAGKGTVLTTQDPAALTAAFAKEADALARQIVVTAQVPSGSDETSSNVLVTVPTADETFTASAYVPVRSAQDIAAEKAAPRPSAGGEVGPARALDERDVRRGRSHRGRAAGHGRHAGDGPRQGGVEHHPLRADPGLWRDGSSGAVGSSRRRRHRTPSPARPGRPPRRRWPTTRTWRPGSRRAWSPPASHSSPRSGCCFARPSSWAPACSALLLASSNIVLGVLVVLAAIIGPWFYLKRKKKKRLKAFGMGLADTLQLMSGSLSAGLSLSQSVDTIVREGAEPIASEFRRVVIESRLGVTIEDALDGVVERMQSRDFGWVVMAIRIQREVGGNLAELLLTVAATLREREYLRRHVRALSAEGRLSCYVLGGLPPGFLAYLTLSKPDYVKPMFSTPIGWMMLVGMVVLLGVGILWMSKVSKVDV